MCTYIYIYIYMFTGSDTQRSLCCGLASAAKHPAEPLRIPRIAHCLSNSNSHSNSDSNSNSISNSNNNNTNEHDNTNTTSELIKESVVDRHWNGERLKVIQTVLFLFSCSQCEKVTNLFVMCSYPSMRQVSWMWSTSTLSTSSKIAAQDRRYTHLEKSNRLNRDLPSKLTLACSSAEVKSERPTSAQGPHLNT